ncbi:glucanase [Virgisporangium aliadipatigenens]|uniref:Glucanase n=1 Tax=Virgisporangium aliadipatigenens TaxID=741659 RepID=A0A8J3YWU6_9ACTN|nr:glycoside hydrolase family 6 protein [Virgisporangium aliadipatigenens]GIJ52157.1 glucanase [Virgisporangium aliadipatigenens]
MRLIPRVRWARRRRGLAAAAAVALVATGTVAAVATSASAAAGCSVTYTANSWPTGFTANLKITNLGDALSSWTLKFSYAGNQQVTQSWGSRYQQSGQNVTLTNETYNGSIPTNGSVTPGFNGSYSGTNVDPTSFTLNGVTCNGGVIPTGGPSSPGSSPSSARPSSAAPSSARPSSAGPSVTTSPPPVGSRVNNPYEGATGYVNPEWKAKAESVSGGNRVSNNPTGVWLDRIAAIEGTDDSSSNGSMGLRDHLDAAVAQGAGYAQFVIYNLPGRDCSALASNGELKPGELNRYKAEYIDPIASIMSDTKYRNLRIIAIIEIDSLPNLVTNTNLATCATMKSNGEYVNGVAYALQKLGAIPNVYNYIDAGHHGWLGWDSNFGPSAELFASTARQAGFNNVHGFITNTANYSALVEPYVKITDTVNGTSVRQAKWIDWNFYVDEQSFAQAYRTKLVSLGFDANIGMLIDTSRNGWGGSARPAGPGPTTSVDNYVNGGRVDRRIHAGNWCNQSGAGLGERPRANPASGIDAYVWIKPPGESDGSSKEIPNNEGKGFDRMCDPTYGGNDRNGNNPTGALDGAPISGAWFPAQFAQLMQNAYPAL